MKKESTHKSTLNSFFFLAEYSNITRYHFINDKCQRPNSLCDILAAVSKSKATGKKHSKDKIFDVGQQRT